MEDCTGCEHHGPYEYREKRHTPYSRSMNRSVKGEQTCQMQRMKETALFYEGVCVCECVFVRKGVIAYYKEPW